MNIKNKTKICQKLGLWQILWQFCFNKFHECFLWRHKMWQKCIKKQVLSQFCHIFGQNISSKCFKFWAKMRQKSVQTPYFARFLTDLWKWFWHILNTYLHFDTFLSYLSGIFDRFLIHFGFWQFFDRILLVFCHIFAFWHIFVTFLIHFWHIFEMGGTYIKYEYQSSLLFS